MLSQAQNDLKELLKDEGIDFTLIEFGYNYDKAVYSAVISVKINNTMISVNGRGRSINELFRELKRDYSLILNYF